MPELYELRAIHAMEQGRTPQAERDLTLAIKLADNPAGPSKQRGVLYATAGRWADARGFRDDASNMPGESEAWFFRAQSQLALGDATAARADMQQAAGGCPVWLGHAPDVARFLARLAQAR